VERQGRRVASKTWPHGKLFTTVLSPFSSPVLDTFKDSFFYILIYPSILLREFNFKGEKGVYAAEKMEN